MIEGTWSWGYEREVIQEEIADLEAQVDPEVVKAIMGHSDILVTRGYQHVDIDMKREALEKVAAFLKGWPEPVKQLSAS